MSKADKISRGCGKKRGGLKSKSKSKTPIKTPKTPKKSGGGNAVSPSTRKCYQPSRRRCDIGYIVKDYVKPIMQAMTVDIREYNMRLITSKCLNTAVMFMVLIFGKAALEDTEHCDVKNVMTRHKRPNCAASRDCDNLKLVEELKKDLLAPSSKRMVYYIMLTDGQFDRGADEQSAFFPGHVMVWEKVPGTEAMHYYIYQSYINEYDYKGSLAFRHWSAVSAKRMHRFLYRLTKFMQDRIWDKRMVNFWKDLTNVDTSEMLGGRPDNCFHLCYRVRENGQCLSNLYRLVENTLANLPSPNAQRDDEIYGSEDNFDKREKPLNNGQMRERFESLRETVLVAIKDDKMPCSLISACHGANARSNSQSKSSLPVA